MTAAARSTGVAALLALGVADLVFLNLWVFPRTFKRRGPISAPVNLAPPAVHVARPVVPAPPPVAPGDAVIARRLAHFGRSQQIPQRADTGSIAEVAALARRHPAARIFVDGHADRSGPAVYNQWPSLQRANAVAERLVQLGADRERIVIRHFGATRPLLDDRAARPMRRQRRVELTLVTGDRHDP